MLENKPYIEISVKQSTKAVSQLGIFHFLILPPDCHLFEIFLEEELSFLKGGWSWGKWHLNWALKHETEKWGGVGGEYSEQIKKVCAEMLRCRHTFESGRLQVAWWASLVTQQWRIHLQGRRRRFQPWVGKMPWRKKWQPTSSPENSLEMYSLRPSPTFWVRHSAGGAQQSVF